MPTSEADRQLEVLTWTDFGRASRLLARSVAASGFQPDLVLAIARGGLPIGGALAYALGVKNCAAINVEFYTGVGQRMEVPVVLPPTPPLVDLAGLRVLLADDVADSGETLALVAQLVRPHVAELRSAVLYKKPRSVVDPDYHWAHTERWISFPWSAEPPVTAG
ncbi:MAG TPA: phosphoribosyltransferase [Acidimicrobiales bacterium]|nr:phosphoribosyltransferase [Acidimicrobiales bacterium]